MGETEVVPGRVGEAGRKPLVSWLAAWSWMGKRSSHEAWASCFPWSMSLWRLGRRWGKLWPNLVHAWGGEHPPCALGMLSCKKFMNLLTHPVLLWDHLCLGGWALRARHWTRLFLWSPLSLMPSSLFLGWICEAINQSSQSKENPLKMEKAGIWQTFLAPFSAQCSAQF